MATLRDHLMLLAQAVFVMCMVVILIRFQPIQREYSTIPVKGDKGDSAVVDYEAINAYIQDELASQPEPADGKNGKDGRDAEPVDYERIDAIVQQKVQAAFDARNNPPAPVLDFEYQTDGHGNKQWRLLGDSDWQLCTPQDDCP